MDHVDFCVEPAPLFADDFESGDLISWESIFGYVNERWYGYTHEGDWAVWLELVDDPRSNEAIAIVRCEGGAVYVACDDIRRGDLIGVHGFWVDGHQGGREIFVTGSSGYQAPMSPRRWALDPSRSQ